MRHNFLHSGIELAVATLLLGLSAVSAAQSDRQVAAGGDLVYEGQLSFEGQPVNDHINIEFRLYDAEQYGRLLEEPFVLNDVNVVDGFFSVDLPYVPIADDQDYRWLEITINGETLRPRQRFEAVVRERQPVQTKPIVQTKNEQPESDGHSSGFDGSGDKSIKSSTSGSGFAPQPASSTFETAAAAAGPRGRRGLLGPPGPPEPAGPPGQPRSSGGARGGQDNSLFGIADDPFGWGVAGWNLADSGPAYGVYGSSRESNNGVGVFGNALATSGPTRAVYGLSRSPAGTGVFGWNNAGSGAARGVFGTTQSTHGSGVKGRSIASSGPSRGVFGQNKSPDGQGVLGWNQATSGDAFGVYGITDSPNGYAGYFLGGRNYFEGNVGIGTTDPQQSLHIAEGGIRFPDGSVQFSAPDGGGGAVSWDDLMDVPPGFADGVDNDTTYNAGQGLDLVGSTFRMDDQNASTGQVLKWNGSGWTPGADETGGGSSLWQQSGSSIYYNSGNVGIGTSSPGANLHVNGNLEVHPTDDLRVVVNDTNDGLWVEMPGTDLQGGIRPPSNSSDGIMLAGESWVYLNGYGSGGHIYCVDPAAGNWHPISAEDFLPPSSRKYKERIRYVSDQELPHYLDLVSRIRPAHYEFINDGSDDGTPKQRHFGLIAEDLPAEVLGRDGDSVSMYSLITTLAAATKQLKREKDEEISALRQRIEILESAIDEFRHSGTVKGARK